MPRLVLNVEDFAPQRHLRTRVLESAGFEVLEAASGGAALALAREHHPALVLLDVQLPDMDGREVCRQLKSGPATSDILVLHISALFRDAATRTEALNIGADGYLAETVEPEELVAHVRALLRLADRKQAEHRVQTQRAHLEAVYQAMSDGLSVFSAEGTLVFANDVVAHRYGFANAEQMGRQQLTQLPFELEELDGRRLPRERWPAARVIAGEALSDWELRVHRPSTGEDWIFSYSGRPVLDENGAVTLAVITSRDITEKKRAEEALRKAHAELADADRRKDEFLAVLSHELRNPLAPIRFALPLLQGQLTDPAGTRALSVIQRQVDHITRLVDDLLDVSRIEKGKIELRPEHVTLGSIMSTAAEEAAPRIAAARHSLSVSVADEPIWVYGDPARLAQVVVNLLVNSAKYTPPGGEISLRAAVEDGRAVIRVRDNGVGIQAEQLPFVFEMFRQIRPAGGQATGIGVGLTLVKRLVEMHGGAVDVRSDGLHKGSEFIVRLPLAEQTLAVDEAAAGTAPGRRVRVLVVDDNADLVQVVALLVEDAGHDVRKALDGRSAISAALSYRPHIILLDLGLPDMSGIEVAGVLRRHADLSGTCLVAMTGWSGPEEREKTRAAGFDHHLTKPADPQELERLLSDVAARL